MPPIRPNPTLPEDLISEILVRVPVKSLLCLQLVCKDWLSLIKHPAFVKSQLRHANTTQTHQALIVTNVAGSREHIALLDVNSRQFVSDCKLPFTQRESDVSIAIGSVSGIVFVYFIVNCKASMYLWNPATRQSKLIPPSFNICYPSGFGYDPIDDEYKVVCFRCKESYSAHVYLANRDEWRRGPDPIDFTYSYNSRRFDVCFNGFLCGPGTHGMMLEFDLHKEVLICAIKLPVIIKDDEDDHDIITSIIEFNKSIVVIKLWDKGCNDGQKINMWMLDDDACLGGGGVEASWTPMFSINVAMPAHSILGYFNNRDLLLLTDDMWISCNVDKKEADIVPLSVEMAGHHYTNIVVKYTESLVSLPGFKQN
ncbi:F-box domain-containing protein [Heracleum sosnowskyi]|uniref:F-box domain-containing protein n=1 Tax=Heracleum sosnowskyi TaxID=360622 RepID=A0AAD8GRR2_9APIA|nr:F-box domain-containing protein [Heracleum sosnowskyi]